MCEGAVFFLRQRTGAAPVPEPMTIFEVLRKRLGNKRERNRTEK